MEAAQYFQNGYSCSESIIKWAIDEGYMREEFLCISTPFSGGMGSGCLCGAIAGSQMVLGHLYGKNNQYGNENVARIKAKEFYNKFVEKHKSSCCRALTKGLDMASKERKAHCTNMLENCQKILIEMINTKVIK